jgi:uncharacterized protein YfaP (DUF2135 family)
MNILGSKTQLDNKRSNIGTKSNNSLSPQTLSWIQSISEALEVSKATGQSIKTLQYSEAYIVDLSQEAKYSSVWDDPNITYPIADPNILTYTRDGEAVYY